MLSSRIAKLKLIETPKDKIIVLHSLFSEMISIEFMSEVRRIIYEDKLTQVHIYDLDVSSYSFTTLDFLFSLPVVQLVFHFKTSNAKAYQPDQVEPRIVELLKNFRTYVLPYYEKFPDAKPLITCKSASIERQVEYQNIFKLSSLEAIDESDDQSIDFGEPQLPDEYRENEQLLNTVYTIELAKKYLNFDYYMETLTQLSIAYNRLITIHNNDGFYIIRALKKEIPEMFIEVCQRLKVNNFNQLIESRDIIDQFARLMEKPNGSGVSYPQLIKQITLIQSAISEKITVLKKSQRTHSRTPSESLTADTPPMDHKKSSSPLLSHTKFRITPPMDRKELPEKRKDKTKFRITPSTDRKEVPEKSIDIVSKVMQVKKFI